MVRSAKAFPFGEGGERSETEEGCKVGIIDGSVEKFCCQTFVSRKLSALVTLFRPRSSGTFPGGEGFGALPHNFYLNRIAIHFSSSILAARSSMRKAVSEKIFSQSSLLRRPCWRVTR